MSLQGAHALITGGSRGIGRGIALKLAEAGVKVAVHYYQNEAAAKDTLAEVRRRGSEGLVVQADVRHPEQIAQMFAKVRAEFGKLEVFVSNARPEAPLFFQPPISAEWNSEEMSAESSNTHEARMTSKSCSTKTASFQACHSLNSTFTVTPTALR